jgi:hypothetical protein
LLALGLFVVIATPALGKAADRLKAYDDALILLDPHAGSAEKFDACVRLRKAADEDATVAIPALARQSKYDQPHIRQLAAETLNLLVGEREAALLRKTVTDAGFLGSRLELRRWSLSLELMLDGRHRPRDILAAALLLWNKSHGVAIEGFPSLDAAAKSSLILGLDQAFASFNAPRRRLAAELADAIDFDYPATRMVLLGLADGDTQLRAVMQKRADKLFVPGSKDRTVISDLVETLTRPNPSPWLGAVGERCLERMGPAARSMAIDLTLARLVEGYPEALFTLISWSAMDTPLAKAVAALGEIPSSHRIELVRFLKDLAIAPDLVQAHAVLLLCDDDRPLRERGASLIAAAGDRVDRHAAVVAGIQSGKPLSPATLKLLDLNPGIINPQLMPLLAAKEARVRLAACGVLKVTGLAGDGVGPAAEALLTDPDDDVCIAAAELLGRSDILTWMRIPPLLKELRNADVTRRMIAARRLDDLGVEPKEITAALLRAVDRRDMPAREGLINALESAHIKRRKTLEMLDQTAAQQDDLTLRAYARAALREIASVR